MWKTVFEVFDHEWDWERPSVNYMHYINPLYKGGETIAVCAPAHKIEKLLDDIEKTNFCLIKLIKEAFIQYIVQEKPWEDKPGVGFIVGDKTFLSGLVEEAHFKWVDKLGGKWEGELKYDTRFLRSLKNVMI